MAIRQQLRRAVQAAQANAQVRSQGAHLLSLPREVFVKILRGAVVDGGVALRKSTTRQSIYGTRKQELDISFKEAYSKLYPFIAASKELRDKCYQYLGEEVTLREENSNTLLFQHKTAYWTKQLLAHIQKLVTGVSQGMKLRPDQMWGQYLQFFITLMPKLIHLELYTEFYHSDRPFPRKMSGEPLGDVERLDQERRCKLFFLAYLTHRHPSLNRIIQPAASGPTWEEGDDKIHHYLIAERSFNETPGDRSFIWDTKTKKASDDVEPTVHEDQVLNATSIRRHYYTPLCKVPDARFTIQPRPDQGKDTIYSSEVSYSDQKLYDFVDSRAYRTRDYRARRGWKEHSTDELLDLCAELPRREKYAAFAVAVATKSIQFWEGTKHTDFATAVSKESANLNLGGRPAKIRARKAFCVRGRGWATASFRYEYFLLVSKVENMVFDRQSELAEEERIRLEALKATAESQELANASSVEDQSS